MLVNAVPRSRFCNKDTTLKIRIPVEGALLGIVVQRK